MRSDERDGDLVGSGPAMEAVRRFARRAAGVDVPVLLSGETGTGKSLLARWIHRRSPRRRAPFVAVNCAGIPEGLFESELFGHQRGAFTGAHADRKGLFELSHGGTLLLDEVGELSPGHQAKLLTVLEDKELRRVGGSRPIRVDVRILSATSRDLTTAVATGVFRRDLFHRIALLHCALPPLRERAEDLDELMSHFLGRAAARHGLPEPRLDGEARRFLRDHPWPGNVREMAHVLEAALILAGEASLGRSHLEAALPVPAHGPVLPPGPGTAAGDGAAPTLPTAAPATPGSHGSPRRRRYSFHGPPAEEKRMIVEALERCRGNRTHAARELGMARNTLRSKLRKYGITG